MGDIIFFPPTDKGEPEPGADEAKPLLPDAIAEAERRSQELLLEMIGEPDA